MKRKATKIVELVIADDSEELTIDAISLVTSPAIEQDFVFFGKENNNLTLAKVDEEKRMLVSPALIPNKQIFRYDPNTDSNYYVYFSKETVRQASELYLKHNNHHKATYQHEDRVSGVLTIESWIKEGEQDKSKLYGFDLPDGTWFVKMKIENDEMWNKIKDGELKGLSIEGYFINKMEKMGKQQFSNEEILEALSELIKEKTELKAEKVDLGVVQDLEKLLKDYQVTSKVIEKDEKLKDKKSDEAEKKGKITQKLDDEIAKLRQKYNEAAEKSSRANKEFSEIRDRIEKIKKEKLGYEKSMNKLSKDLNKFITALEKQLNKFKKAAKSLGVDVPTKKYDKVISDAISIKNNLKI